ncbi:MAG: glycosyltransferase family 2 protein [Opitutaceae bacterium]
MFSIVIPIGPNRDGVHALRSLQLSGVESEDEVIVVGDGFLPDVKEDYGLPLLIMSTLEQAGANSARNYGAKMATQPYLCFLDDDDEHLPNALKRLREIVAHDASVSVWSLTWMMLSGRPMPTARGAKQINEADICRRNFAGGCSSMLLKRDSFWDAGGFDDQMKSMQDWDLWLRLSRHQSIEFTSEPLILYRDHGEARISTNVTARIAGLERLYYKHSTNWSKSVRAFHKARLAAECYKSKEGSWFSIFHWRAPLASLAFALKSFRR